MTSANTQTSPDPEPSRGQTQRAQTSWDRRTRVRFPVSLPFFYRTVDRTLRCGVGRILNISSTGILAACHDQLNVDTTVEITIEWPVRVDGEVPIHLVMLGNIVRCEMSRFAVASSQLRLRPVGKPSRGRRVPDCGSTEPGTEESNDEYMVPAAIA